MNEKFFLSRSFVEFGPFDASELKGFHKRGLLKETDYVRGESTDEWVHVNDWATAKAPEATTTSAAPEPAAVVAEPAPKAKKETAKPKAAAPATKAAPAKKAAKKSA